MMRGSGGYGFNLHGERGVVGQFISAVDDGGIADKAGLCVGDRIVEVNGVNVESATHSQVVAKVREDPEKAVLLVIDKVTDDFLKQHDIPITSRLAELSSVLELLEENKKEKKTESNEAVEPEVSIQENGDVQGSPNEEAGQQRESVEPPALTLKTEDQDTQGPDQVQAESPADEIQTEASEGADQPSDVGDQIQSTVEPAKPIIEIQTEITNEVQDADRVQSQEQPESTENQAANAEPEPAVPKVEENGVQEQNTSDENQNTEIISEQAPPATNISESEPAEVTPSPHLESNNVQTVKDTENKSGGLTLTSMAAALPKPKRKSIKEGKVDSWASKAALFNNL